MTRALQITVSAAILTLCLQIPSWAEDINPPTWRGNLGTTWAQYEFLTPGVPNGNGGFVYDGPDNGFLPAGPALLTHVPGPGAGWHEKQPTGEFGLGSYDPLGPAGDGWVNLSGEIILTLQNFDNNNPRKVIWLQMDWEPQSPNNVPTIQIVDPAGGQPSTIPLVRNELWQQGSDPTNPWRVVNHDVWHLELFPNPAQETIVISGGINVDELVVDTWCVPEPSSLAILGMAFASLLLCFRRRS